MGALTYAANGYLQLEIFIAMYLQSGNDSVLGLSYLICFHLHEEIFSRLRRYLNMRPNQCSLDFLYKITSAYKIFNILQNMVNLLLLYLLKTNLAHPCSWEHVCI